MLELFKRLLFFKKTEKQIKKMNESVLEDTAEVMQAKEDWRHDVIQFEKDIRRIHRTITQSTAYRIAKRTGNLSG